VSPSSQSDGQLDVYGLRRAVGQWLRIKADRPFEQAQAPAMNALVAQGAQAMYRQLAADAEHSDLLIRLFKGEEPRPR
jgi:hypothetical protein